MKKFILLIIAVIFLASCATTPPAPSRFEKGFYIYPKHEFAVKTPEGWHQTKRPPDWMGSSFMPKQHHHLRIIFLNNTTNGFISITSDKVNRPYHIMAMNPHGLIKFLDKSLKETKKKLLKNPTCKSCDYEIINFNRWNEFATFSTVFLNLKSIIKGYMYSCCEDDACILTFNMVSTEENYITNISAFYSVVNSFQDNPFYKHYFNKQGAE